MASWIPSSIQKRLLRYALNRSGLLDVTGIDLDNLDISWGRRTTLEFKNVNLNVEYLAGLAQLPPSLRLETARILLLRLTIPADILSSSISVEVDGVDVVAKIKEEEDAQSGQSKPSERTSRETQSPSHRKTNRRIQSPVPRTYGESRLPTTEDLAKSFLAEEPLEERRKLEASVAANAKPMDESIFSESSDGSDTGTGAAPGLPGFLSSWLQRLIDRFQMKIRSIHLTLGIDTIASSSGERPTDLIVKLERADILPVPEESTKREVQLGNFSVELKIDEEMLSDLSHFSPPASPTASRATKSSRHSEDVLNRSLDGFYQKQASDPTNETTSDSDNDSPTHSSSHSIGDPLSPSAMATNRDLAQGTVQIDESINDLGIQMGDDNFSWTSRRSQGDGPTDDPWSRSSEDDLPESLVLGMNYPLPPSRSSAASSSPSRSRRATSPYDRAFQGPGSWPHLEDSPKSSRHQVGPGSWPALEQSQNDLFQSLTSESAQQADDVTDNKRSAMEASVHEAQSPPLAETDEDQNDLEESRYFSHEEAESMYLSAVTVAQEARMPGAWESQVASRVEHNIRGSSSVHEDRSGSIPTPETGVEGDVPTETSESHSDVPSETATPRGLSPSTPTPTAHQQSRLDDLNHAILQLIFIDAVTMILPSSGTEEPDSSLTADVQPTESTDSISKSLAMSRAGMPGAFSTYSKMSSSQRRGVASMAIERETVAERAHTATHPLTTPSQVEIQVGMVRLQADIPTAQLFHRLGTAITPRTEKEPAKKSNTEGQHIQASLTIESLELTLHHKLQHRLDQSTEDLSPGLLSLNIRHGRADSKPAQYDILLGTLHLDVGEHRLLSFDKDVQALSESMVFDEDLKISVDTSEVANNGRPISRIEMTTRPVRLDISLSVFDEVFSTFGGLSGVLDLGNSMTSDASPMGPPVTADRSQRVRFEGDTNMNDASTEYKVSATVAGLTVVLCADQTAVALQSATIKALYRETGVRASGSLRLSGPYVNGDNHAPFHIDLVGVTLRYLFEPQEADFDRLLALITPSKDKYDNDDDILIGTLLRQRRKGACLRVGLDDVKVKIDSLDKLSSLQTLSTETARLSVVTKYLPEDERPGLLTLLHIKNAEARLPINDRFGTLRATFKELQCAHVGLPALLALSLSDVYVTQSDGPDLIHPLLPLAGAEDLPMIMARMLDDEGEPVVKVKLYNVCAEYSVSTLLKLTKANENVDAEELNTELAASVVDLASGRHDEQHLAGSTSQTAKKTHLHLLLHDSAIGLSPQTSPSKALLILTDARVSTAVPPADIMSLTLELHQAGILVTDDVGKANLEASTSRRNPPESTVVNTRVLHAFSKRGYASVGSIMSAVVTARIEQATHRGSNSVEVDVRNDFLLLETCADSMQTLTGVLGGLSPPTPPSKQPKYLTEPITIDDMISSFSGDAYAKPAKHMETLFDADDEQDYARSDNGDDADKLLTDADMDSSLYGPISGMIGDLDDHEQQTQDYGETVESLLEDDPFEMTMSPDDMPFSDSALLRDLKQQALRTESAEPVDLGNYEIEDLGYDALGVDEQALGMRHRFCAPTSRREVAIKTPKKLPFKLKLRDVNATWHMHDGYDWQKTRDGITAAVEHVEQRAEERLARRRQARVEPEDEESTIGDCMFNSVYITVPNNLTEPPDIRRGINRQIDDLASESESIPASGMSRPTTYSAGGRPIRQTSRRRLKLERSRYHKISFELKGLAVDMDVFPPDSDEMQSTVDVSLKQFEIFDNVPTSTWKKFLTRQTGSGSQELAKPMVHIELLNRRTVQQREATDLMIHVAIQPLRLHVDQDALDFITRFTEFKDSSAGPPSSSDQPFLSRVEVETVDLQLDYKPKKVDYVGLRSGHATEFMNFVILEQANIKLRHAIVYGIRGFDPLHKTLNDVWMPDVKRNQLPTIVGGLAAVRSLVAIGTGVRDVVAIPIREYKKDGRIVRSVQKGAFHFGKTTASELARLGAKVAIGTQNLLSGAEGLLAQHDAAQSSDRAGTNPDDDDEDRQPRAYSAYAEQPLGVLSGLKSARRYLEHDLLTARDALIAVQGEVLESSNPGSAAMAVARHAPTVMLRPVIGASRAIGTTLLGVGNQIDRDGVKRMEDVSICFSWLFWLVCTVLTLLAEIQTSLSSVEKVAM